MSLAGSGNFHGPDQSKLNMASPDSGNIPGPNKSKIHSILINKTDESVVEISSKDYLDIPMRPRAYTDPSSPRPKMKHRVHFDLPEITVDDYSEYDDEGKDNELREKANTSEGAFFVYASPPRRRSNTCPWNFWGKKPERPGTPPPETKNSINKVENQVASHQRGVSFSPHRLTKVAEESKESKTDPKAQGVTLLNKRNDLRKDSVINSTSTRRRDSDPDISCPLTSDTRPSRVAGRHPHDTGGHLAERRESDPVRSPSSPLTSDTRPSRTGARNPRDTGVSHYYVPNVSSKQTANISNDSRNSSGDSNKSVDHIVQSTA